MKDIVKILILFIFLIVGKITLAQCDFTGTVTVSASGFEAGASFSQDYIIVDSETGLILQLNSSGLFTVNSGDYSVHAVNYDGSRPAELAVGQTIAGVQAYDANSSNCFDMISSTIVVCEEQCLESANISVSAKNYEVGAGYDQTYVLVSNGSGNIISSNTTGDFPTFIFPSADVYKVYAVNSNSTIVSAEISDLGAWSDVEALDASDCADIIGPKYINVIDCPVVLAIDDLNLVGDVLMSSNMLFWNHIEYQNMDYYEVQRSYDSKNFTTIGTTNSPKFYDKEPYSTSYYRLKVNFKEGESKFSNVISLDRESDFSIVSLYPNPTYGTLNLNLQSEDGLVTIEIHNAVGQIVQHLSIDVNSGINNIQLDISNLREAMYNLSVNNGERKIQQKVVKF